MRLPDFVIVGAMRSGTTTLSRILRDMPFLDMAAGKEVRFFDDHYSRGISWYSSLFAALPEQSVVGEASPNYMYDEVARDRLTADLPDTRFVAILRNPIDRAWSHYWFNSSREKEPLSFEDALEAEPSRLEASARDRRAYSYIDRGHYAVQLRPLVERIGAGRLHVMYFENFIARPAAELSDLAQFLGLPEGLVDTVAVDIPKVNRYVEFRSVRLRDSVKRLPLPLRRVVGRLNARTRVSYPPMANRTRAMLRGQLADSVKQTASVVGREPRLWKDWY